MVRMKVHKAAPYITDQDIIVVNDAAIQMYESRYPNIKVQERLQMLNKVFTYRPESRAEDSTELKLKIRQWFAIPNVNEEFVKRLCKTDDYITIEEEQEIKALLWKEL